VNPAETALMNWPKSQQLLAENSRFIPGGLASLNRKADPVIAFVRARGSRLWDIDGREPCDWWDILEHHDAGFDLSYRRALIERGIYHFPVMVKQGSISFAHREGDIDQTLEATDDALRAPTHGDTPHSQ